ncbi:Dynein heavy chain 3, axonemal [Acipenser ruthenus]|uniref:Dynein heavy chain 3, axonemal n=1 Tax=Acipenser ruthenus TaxID=7906 RepID=A0A662YU16_ACIRT|nr:Dynein heavy chain 3, axonemal [Acipenser ruthenus]
MLPFHEWTLVLNYLYYRYNTIVLRHSQYPPILQSPSWNLAVPFKEQRHHRSPSESIGNNYTPSASNLKIKDLQNKFSYVRASTTLVSPRLRPLFPSKASPPVEKKLKLASKSKPFAERESTQVALSLLSHSNGHDLYNSASVHPGSRPMTPTEQLNSMVNQEEEISKSMGEPSERDLEASF